LTRRPESFPPVSPAKFELLLLWERMPQLMGWGGATADVAVDCDCMVVVDM